MNFITIKDGMVTGIHCGQPHPAGSPFDGHQVIEVPAANTVQDGDTLDFYDDNWKRKPLCQLIKEGLSSMPENCVIDCNEVRFMTTEELIAEGKVECPKGMKLEKGKLVEFTQVEQIEAGMASMPMDSKIVDGKIVAMTYEERYEAGLITQEKYDDDIKLKHMKELDARLASVNNERNKAMAVLDEEFAIAWKEQIRAILAVQQQEGYPLTANFSE